MRECQRMRNLAYHWRKVAFASADWTLCGPPWASRRGRVIYIQGVLGAQDKASDKAGCKASKASKAGHSTISLS